MGIFNRVKSKSLKFFSLFILAIILTLGLSISFQSLLAAWTAPLANPAICLTGNPGCDSPLNIGPLIQTKSGALWINTNGISPLGLIVEKGNVGIGVVSPTYKLQIAGPSYSSDNHILVQDINGGTLFSLSGNGNTLGNFGPLDFYAQLGPNDSNLVLNYAFQKLITTGVNVGISTLSPLNRMDVNGAVAIGSYAGVNTAPTQGLIVSGNVGIGTANPGAKLEVAGQVKITGGTPGAGKVLTSDINGLATWGTSAVSSQWTTVGSNIYYNTGNVGIGTAAPAQKLEVAGSVKITGAGIYNSAGYELLETDATDWTRWNQGSGTTNGNAMYQSLSLGTGGLSVGAWSNQGMGNIYATGILQIAGAGNSYISGNVGIGINNPGVYKLNVQGTARISSDLTVEGKFNLTGADVAEEFSTPENYEAGTVLVMGDNGYRSARVSSRAYDTTVIGVVSDNPAIIMGKAAGANKAIVAIAGVIKVKATDSNGKIMKGDLLTTSATAGYAMKATENKLGTIIGKALEDLKGGRGEIMTLINLQ